MGRSAPQRRRAGPRGRERRPRAVALPPRVPFEDRAAYGGCAGRRLDPPQAGPEAFPQGFIAPEARAGSDPDRETTGVTSAGFPGRRTDVRRGVAHSPALRPKSGERIRQQAAETQRGQRVSRTSAPERYAHKYATKGGLP